MTSRITRWAAGAILVVSLAACGTQPPPQAPEPQTAPNATVPTVLPLRLQIPSIGVDSRDIASTGLDENHQLKVPPLSEPKKIAWYAASPAPGDAAVCSYGDGCTQSSVLTAHINANHVQGAFARLAKLKKGAKIAVERSDGKTAHFTVTKVMIFKKAAFNPDDVYGDITSALTLITCGPGDLVRTAHGGSYAEQTVVQAALTSTTPTAP